MLPASFLPVFLRSSVARGWGYVGKRCQKSSDDPLWRQGLNTQLSLVNQALHEIFPKAFSPLSLPPPLLFCSCCKYVEKKRLWYKKVLLCCGRKGAQGRIKQPRPQKGSEGRPVLSGPSFPFLEGFELLVGGRRLPLPDTGPPDCSTTPAKSLCALHGGIVTAETCKWK